MKSRFFNQARRELREAKSDVVRQAEETKLLLREAAQRHMDTEASVEGEKQPPSYAFVSPIVYSSHGVCVWRQV